MCFSSEAMRISLKAMGISSKELPKLPAGNSTRIPSPFSVQPRTQNQMGPNPQLFQCSDTIFKKHFLPQKLLRSRSNHQETPIAISPIPDSKGNNRNIFFTRQYPPFFTTSSQQPRTMGSVYIP